MTFCRNLVRFEVRPGSGRGGPMPPGRLVQPVPSKRLAPEDCPAGPSKRARHGSGAGEGPGHGIAECNRGHRQVTHIFFTPAASDALLFRRPPVCSDSHLWYEALSHTIMLPVPYTHRETVWAHFCEKDMGVGCTPPPMQLSSCMAATRLRPPSGRRLRPPTRGHLWTTTTGS